MSILREENPDTEVLMAFDADTKADLNSLFSWLEDGLLKGPPEPLAEGKFVALLEPGVHHYVVEKS